MSNDLSLGDLKITISTFEDDPATAKFEMPDGSVVVRNFPGSGELDMRLGLGLQLHHLPLGEAPDPLEISGTPVLTATEDEAYAGFTVSATGGTEPYAFTVLSGAFPDGVTLNSSTGAVSGTPTEAGTFADIVIRVTDAADATDDLAGFTIEVEAAAATDPTFANNVLLIEPDGVNGATTTTDYSNSAHTPTFVGNAQLVTDAASFSGLSIDLDGSGDRVTFPNSDDWKFGSGPFTIETFLDLDVVEDFYLMAFSGSGSSVGWAIQRATGTWRFLASTNGSTFAAVLSVADELAINTRYHVMVDRDAGGVTRLYRDGVMLVKATFASTIFASTGLLVLGAAGNGALDVNGQLSGIRLKKGVARCGSDAGFTVPTEAYPRS